MSERQPTQTLRRTLGTILTGSSSEFVGRNDEQIDHAEYAARTGHETRQLSRLLEEYAPDDANVSAELGAAYGRLVTTIEPFSENHIAVEPRDEPRSRIKPLYPSVDVRKGVGSDLPIETGTVDIFVTWVVLQHVKPENFDKALEEIDRVVSDRGVCLFCEEGNPDAGDGVGTFARPVDEYNDALENFALIHTEPRELEPTFDRDDAGTVMVFER